MSSVSQHPVVDVADTDVEGELVRGSALMLSFLGWIGSGHRSYAETMEAWRTSCPRFTIWEDALDDDLVRLESGDDAGRRETQVILTPRGRSVLIGIEN